MIKILLVDDHEMFRKSLKQLLNQFDDMQVVGECTDGIYVSDYLFENNVDVILLDYNMPKQDGFETAKEISINFPKVKIIGFSSHESSYVRDKMMEVGAVDYMTKNTDVDVMLDKIRRCVINEIG